MGNFNSYLKMLGLAPHEIRILIFGLDAAGKTTILYKMKLGEVVTTIPTIGFNVETINHNNLNIVTFDVGGRDKIRPLYRHYYQNTQALIYVIDSNDKERINEVEEEISKMLREDELRDCIFMILANKQDLKDAMKADEIKKLINFDSIKQTPKNIFETTATTGEGLKEAFDWLTSCFENGKKKENFLTQPLNETVEDIKKLKNVTSFFFKWSNFFKAITE